MVGELGFRLSLSRSRAAPRDVRHDLAAWMPQRCDPWAAETAVLLASELVTNAVVHTGGERVDVRATCDGDRLRVAVEDDTRTVPDVVHRQSEPPAGEGRGLWMVDAMASRWGCESLSDGKRMWFEVPCTPDGCGQNRGGSR